MSACGDVTFRGQATSLYPAPRASAPAAEWFAVEPPKIRKHNKYSVVRRCQILTFCRLQVLAAVEFAERGAVVIGSEIRKRSVRDTDAGRGDRPSGGKEEQHLVLKILWPRLGTHRQAGTI